MLGSPRSGSAWPAPQPSPSRSGPSRRGGSGGGSPRRCAVSSTPRGSVGAGDVAARAEADAGPAQVREVATAFNEMADRVSSLLDAQSMMTADVSHQLRTPLAALRLRLDLLVDEVPDELQPEVVGMISETTRLSRLVDGLLAVAQADATVSAPQPVDVGAVCADRISSWEPLASERGIRLELTADQRCFALATPGHLEQVLDNALANALDALPSRRHRRARSGQDRGQTSRCASPTTARA